MSQAALDLYDILPDVPHIMRKAIPPSIVPPRRIASYHLPRMSSEVLHKSISLMDLPAFPSRPSSRQKPFVESNVDFLLSFRLLAEIDSPTLSTQSFVILVRASTLLQQRTIDEPAYTACGMGSETDPDLTDDDTCTISSKGSWGVGDLPQNGLDPLAIPWSQWAPGEILCFMGYNLTAISGMRFSIVLGDSHAQGTSNVYVYDVCEPRVKRVILSNTEVDDDAGGGTHMWPRPLVVKSSQDVEALLPTTRAIQHPAFWYPPSAFGPRTGLVESSLPHTVSVLIAQHEGALAGVRMDDEHIVLITVSVSHSSADCVHLAGMLIRITCRTWTPSRGWAVRRYIPSE